MRADYQQVRRYTARRLMGKRTGVQSRVSCALSAEGRVAAQSDVGISL